MATGFYYRPPEMRFRYKQWESESSSLESETSSEESSSDDEIIPKKPETQRDTRSINSVRLKLAITKAARKYPRVFISHCWGKNERGNDNHALASRLNNYLKQSRILTWFDESDMGHDLPCAMSSGIDWADIVLVLVTRKYIDKCASAKKDNCRSEFSYAVNRKGVKKILLCVVDKSCLEQSTWNGPFGLVCCDQLYVDCTGNNFHHSAIAAAVQRRMLD